MDFRFSAEEERFREELRAFLRQELPANWTVENDREELSDKAFAFSREFARKLAARGWLTMTWPREYGGRAAGPLMQLVYNEEMGYSGAPLGFGFGPNLVGPTLMIWGNEDQRRRHLPPIANGDTFWCQGFSEPGSGSDLASLQTRAIRDGDDFVISGQKIWTSEGHRADWMILLARTDVVAPKHRGISYFLVDLRTPGITVQPLMSLMNAHAFNQFFFDEVRVPKENLVGEVNQGWYVATTTLDFERSGITRVIWAHRLLREVVASLADARRHELAPRADGPSRQALARLHLEFEVARLLCYRVAWQQAEGAIPNHESSMAKLFASELIQRFATIALTLFGPAGQLERDSPWAALGGRIVRAYLAAVSYTIAGGTSEIQRSIIAVRGLGLPRSQ